MSLVCKAQTSAETKSVIMWILDAVTQRQEIDRMLVMANSNRVSDTVSYYCVIALRLMADSWMEVSYCGFPMRRQTCS